MCLFVHMMLYLLFCFSCRFSVRKIRTSQLRFSRSRRRCKRKPRGLRKTRLVLIILNTSCNNSHLYLKRKEPLLNLPTLPSSYTPLVLLSQKKFRSVLWFHTLFWLAYIYERKLKSFLPHRCNTGVRGLGRQPFATVPCVKICAGFESATSNL